MSPLVAVLVAALLGAAVAALPLYVAIRFVVSEAHKSRKVAEARAIAQQTYITELQNRLLSHSWTDFAQLQNDVATHTGQTATVLNGFGEARSAEAYGEDEADLLERLMQDSGADLEGPTVG